MHIARVTAARTLFRYGREEVAMARSREHGAARAVQRTRRPECLQRTNAGGAAQHCEMQPTRPSRRSTIPARGAALWHALVFSKCNDLL